MPANDLSRRLSKLVDDLKDVNTKLTRINDGWADPPQPDKPEIKAQLDALKAQAAITTRLADGMIGRLGL